MKLFVWVDPYGVSYGSSLLIAAGENVDEAREQAASGKAYVHGKFANSYDPRRHTKDLEEPDRILDLPCAEWHEWSE